MVETKVLNQAVKRNADRFPEDFMLQLTNQEKEEVVTNCDHLKRLRKIGFEVRESRARYGATGRKRHR